MINVNSLQVVAPSKTHLDAMMDGQGRIGDAAVKQLLDGQAPRSAEGRIQIDGKINALEKVRLEARRIDIDGRIKAGVDAAHDAAFRAAVSTQGLSVAIGMVERGGVIELIADDGVNLNGQLDASQRVALAAPDVPKAGLGGGIDIRAEKIELGADSHIDVSGLRGGGVAVIGSVSLPAVPFSSSEGSTPISTLPSNAPPVTQTLMAAKGSRVEADAIERGNGGRIQYLSDGSADWGGFGSSRGGALMGHGGFVEVSGRRRAQVYGLVDTTAPKGTTGKLLIDPKHLLIANGEAGDSACRNDAAAETCTLSTGSVVALASKANLELLASDSISFAAGTKLDLYTVLTDSASQSIAFTSKDITLNSEARIVTGGGSVKLNAGGQIWMAKDSAIITRGVGAADSSTAELTSPAGDVSLQGKSIRLDQGSSILAHRVSSFSNYLGGKVELKASSAQQYHLGLASASSEITLAGSIKAERISVTADARAEASPSGPTGYAVQYVLANIGALSGMGAAYHEAQADAKIEVQGTAILNARTTLDLLSHSVNKAAGSVDVATVQENGTTLPTLGALVVRSAGLADVQVKSGARLQSGGKTTVAAYNDATAHGAVSLTSTNSESGLAVSYVDAKVSSNAQIDAGAIVQVGGLDLLSLQTGNMRSTVDVKLMRKQPVDGQAAPTDAAIGSSVAISLLNVSSKATLGANVLGYDGVGKTGNVTVVSDASLSQNFSSARTQVVPFGLVDIVAAEKTKLFQPYANLLPDLLSNWLDDKAKLLKSGTNDFPLKASAVVTFNETDLSSAARIGKAAVVNADGNVAVVAQAEDRAIHKIADSTVNTKNARTSQPAGSAAVAVGLYEHNAEATVGEKAEVRGAHIGVQSHVFQPLDVTWLAGFNSEAWKATVFQVPWRSISRAMTPAPALSTAASRTAEQRVPRQAGDPGALPAQRHRARPDPAGRLAGQAGQQGACACARASRAGHGHPGHGRGRATAPASPGADARAA